MGENKKLQAKTVSEEQLKNVVGGRAAIMECPKCKSNSYFVSTTNRYCTACGFDPALKDCPQCGKRTYKVQFNIGSCSECNYYKDYSGPSSTSGSSPTPIDSASPGMPVMP